MGTIKWNFHPEYSIFPASVSARHPDTRHEPGKEKNLLDSGLEKTRFKMKPIERWQKVPLNLPGAVRKI